MSAVLRRFRLLLALGLALPCAAQAADDWVAQATISPTTTLQNGRLCYTDGRDLACNDNSGGLLSTSSTIHAAAFVGDGSGLTGVVASTGDRVVSGTTSMVAISDTGYISVTQNSYNTAYFHPTLGLVAVGISTTGRISTTDLTVRGFIDVMSGTAITAVGNFAGTYSSGDYLTAIGANAASSSSGSTVTAVGYFAAQLSSGSNVVALGNRALQFNKNDGVVAIGTFAGRNLNIAPNATLIGINAGRYASGSYVIAIGAGSGSGPAYQNSGSDVIAIGRDAAKTNIYDNVIALGYNAKSNKANQVILGNGSIVEVTTTGVILAAGVSTTGVISATRFVGDGSGLTGVVASSGDRVVSGTTSMVAISNTGYISITQSGYNTAYFQPALGLVAVGVSTTGPISATRGYFNGSVTIAAASGGAGTGPSFQVESQQAGESTIRLLQSSKYTDFIQQDALLFVRPSTASGAVVFQNIGGIRFMGLYASTNSVLVGQHGAGAVPPSATLHVMGNFLTTSWTGINFDSTNVTPTAPLEVSGTVSATRFVGDGSGLTGVGVSDLFALTHVSASEGTVRNLFLGTTTGANAGVTGTTALGINALSDAANMGYANTAVGDSALASNSTGYWNTAVGRRALLANTTGIYNTAVGTKGLAGLVDGSNNTAMGRDALAIITNGYGNTSLGARSMAIAKLVTETTAVGLEAGYGVSGQTVHQAGTYVGAYAGRLLTTGNSNTLIGYKSGYNLSTGSANIALGTNTDLYSNTGNYQLNIGNVIYGDIGRGADSRIGINVTSPTANLEVSGTVSATHFVGDGSGLTGVVASTGDRVVSGTTSMVAISDTGYISVTQNSYNTAYFHPTLGLVAVGISTTGPISGTTGYFSGSAAASEFRVGNISSGYPRVSWWGGNSTYPAITFSNSGSGIRYNTSQGRYEILVSGTSYVQINTTRTDIMQALTAQSISVTQPEGISSTAGYFSGNVGLGVSAPTTRLEVSGTVRLSGSSGAETCAGTNNYGTLRINPTTGKLQICRQ